jgi:16S rRNA (cytidine1402-2'-O)-methyltransferase
VASGTLYVVATPLGNLGDLSARAASLLREVPVVAAEDTRRTARLLAHLEARPRLISYHAHSARSAVHSILRVLGEGQDVALVSDAGTPAVSDPGAALVAEVRSAGFAIVPLPGPSAVATALSAAGLPADRYLFLGFLPRGGAERTRLLERIGEEAYTIVLFEAPGRVGALLRDLVATCGPDRQAVVARELTKLHEEIRAGSLGELAQAYDGADETRGECTVVLAGSGRNESAPDQTRARAAALQLLAAGVGRREAAGLLSSLYGLPRNEAYRMVVESAAEKNA